MTEQEQLEVVLSELRRLLLAFGDLGNNAVLIGGQVIAAERMARGEEGVIEVETRTGIKLQRGYSLEPDLLLDLADRDAIAEMLPIVLREQGYERTRDYRWRKMVGDVVVSIDLFRSGDVSEPTGMTVLPSADRVLAQPELVSVTAQGTAIELSLPSPAAFAAMKLEAKLGLRPQDPRDCFDLYVYICEKSPEVMARSLARWSWSRALAEPLRKLFGDTSAPGVADVLSYAATLDESQRDLVAQDIVDRFADLFAALEKLLK